MLLNTIIIIPKMNKVTPVTYPVTSPLTLFAKRAAKRENTVVVITAIIILIQFGWIAFTLYEAGAINPWFSLGFRVISLVCALYVVYKDMRPHNKLSWISLILLLSFIGCPCYFIFGRSEMTKKSREQIMDLQACVEPMREQQEDVNIHLKEMDATAYKQMMLPQKTMRVGSETERVG